MTLTAELSLYPLTGAYEEPIIAFIKDLRAYPGLDIRVFSTCTRVVGDYDLVTRAISDSMKSTFAKGSPVVLVTKFINADLREDPADL